MPLATSPANNDRTTKVKPCTGLQTGGEWFVLCFVSGQGKGVPHLDLLFIHCWVQIPHIPPLREFG